MKAHSRRHRAQKALLSELSYTDINVTLFHILHSHQRFLVL